MLIILINNGNVFVIISITENDNNDRMDGDSYKISSKHGKKRKIQEKKDISKGTDEFMKLYKYYKSNKPKPSLEEVLTVEKSCSDKIANWLPSIIIEDPRTEIMGLKSVEEWQIFTIKRNPGLLFIKNPFTNLGQRYWIRKCLEEYPRKPNKLNIDIDSNLQDWWAECFKNETCDKQLQKKLRWTTLGYHHNWDTKVYSEDNRTAFPNDLAELSDVFATYLGYTKFRAEAAIVNYYHLNSTLSAHTDHSEVNLDAPLFSFSFGQSAIFLIGGIEKTISPTAVLIESGDIVVMSKEARLCYHAVPKILPSMESPWDISRKQELSETNIDVNNFKYISYPERIVSAMKENEDNQEWNKFRNYIQESRINMNVRQVLNEKQLSL